MIILSGNSTCHPRQARELAIVLSFSHLALPPPPPTKGQPLPGQIQNVFYHYFRIILLFYKYDSVQFLIATLWSASKLPTYPSALVIQSPLLSFL